MRFNLQRECPFTTFSNPMQEDIGADHLNMQEAREAPLGHSQPAGQAGRLYAIRERSASQYIFAGMPPLISPLCSGSLLNPRI